MNRKFISLCCLAGYCVVPAWSHLHVLAAEESESHSSQPHQDSSFRLGDSELHAPNWHMNADGVHYAPTGFILTSGNYQLLGDALRWDMDQDILFATGRLRFALPGILIEAASLGSRLGLRQGEAWDVVIIVRQGQLERRLSARHLTWNDDTIIASGIRGAGGHGGILGVAAGRLEIGRRASSDDQRDGPAQHLTHIQLDHLRLSALGVPLLYWPVLYRDFRRDYPWTHYHAGQGSRQGWYLDAAIGWRLPPAASWHLRPLIEIDSFSKLGTAVTARLQGRHDHGGQLDLSAFAVRHGPGQRNRWHYEGIDGWWQSRWQDDSWRQGAANLRYSNLPVSWPGEDRRQLYVDLFAAQARQQDLPRQGGSAAQQWDQLGVSLDMARHPGRVVFGGLIDHLSQAQRDIGLHLTVPNRRIWGPLHLHAEVIGEQWSQPDNSTDPEDSGRWLGLTATLQHHRPLPHIPGIAIQHAVHLTSQSSDDWVRQDQAQNDVHGAQTRFSQSWQANLWRPGQMLQPAVGWSYHSAVWGNSLGPSGWPMPDPLRETWTADASLDWQWSLPALSGLGSGWTVRSDADASWRWHDRSFDLAVATVNVHLDGPQGHLDASWRWQPDTAGIADINAWWRVSSWLKAELGASQINDQWQLRPGFTVDTQRYALVAQWRWDDSSGVTADRRWNGFRLGIERRMVDGILGLSYDWQRDQAGNWLDEGIHISWQLGGIVVP